MKKVLSILVAILMCSIVPVQADDIYYAGIRVVIDGNDVEMTDVKGIKVQPFIANDTTYLPIRAISEAFGFNVEWDNATRTVFIGEKGEAVLGDEINIYINGKEFIAKDANSNRVYPMNVKGSVYLPIRAISEAFGKTVTWEPFSRSVKIRSHRYPDTVVDPVKEFNLDMKYNIIDKESGLAWTCVTDETGKTINVRLDELTYSQKQDFLIETNGENVSFYTYYKELVEGFGENLTVIRTNDGYKMLTEDGKGVSAVNGEIKITDSPTLWLFDTYYYRNDVSYYAVMLNGKYLAGDKGIYLTDEYGDRVVWRMKEIADYEYVLINYVSGLALEVEGGSNDVGAAVVLGEFTGEDNQIFTRDGTNKTGHRFKMKHSGRYITYTGECFTQEYVRSDEEQNFTLEGLYIGSNTLYDSMTVFSSGLADVDSDGINEELFVREPLEWRYILDGHPRPYTLHIKDDNGEYIYTAMLPVSGKIPTIEKDTDSSPQLVYGPGETYDVDIKDGEIEFTKLEREVVKANIPMFDTIEFDIDGDGVLENCSIYQALLASAPTLEFIAYENGDPEYVTRSNVNSGKFNFNVYEGKLQIICKDTNTDEIIQVFDIMIEAGVARMKSVEE